MDHIHQQEEDLAAFLLASLFSVGISSVFFLRAGHECFII